MIGTEVYQQLLHKATRTTPERLLELMEFETSAEVHWPDGSIETVKWDQAVDLVEAGVGVIWRFGIKGYFRSKFPEVVQLHTAESLVVELDGHAFHFERLAGGWQGFCKEDCLEYHRQLRGNLLDIKLSAYQALDVHLG